MAKKKPKRRGKSRGKKEKKISEFSENWLRTVLRNRAGLCHCKRPLVAGKSLCQEHLDYQREVMRRRLGVKRPHVRKEDFLTVDWSFGDAAVAGMLGCSAVVATRWRRRLIRSGELKRDYSVKGNVRRVLSPG